MSLRTAIMLKTSVTGSPNRRAAARLVEEFSYRSARQRLHRIGVRCKALGAQGKAPSGLGIHTSDHAYLASPAAQCRFRRKTCHLQHEDICRGLVAPTTAEVPPVVPRCELYFRVRSRQSAKVAIACKRCGHGDHRSGSLRPHHHQLSAGARRAVPTRRWQRGNKKLIEQILDDNTHAISRW